MNKRASSNYILLILLGVAILPLFAFFHSGFPVTHDGLDHVVRIANFYASLKEGIWIPRWAGNLNWGYGHPILMFLYPFSSYAASGFLFVGFSSQNAMKAVFVVAYIASILSMYLWMHAAWGKKVGLVGSLLYGFAPYRFVDLYVRGAIGEHMAFVFPPLVCYFLYMLATQKKNIKYIVGLSLSIGAFVLSHNAISLMFLPVIGLYMLYLYLFEAKKSLLFILYCFISFVLGFGLSSFFWVPAFFEGKYTLRNIVTAGEAMTRFVPWLDFFNLSWNYGGTATLSKSIGFVQWIGIAVSFIFISKTKNKNMRIYIIFSLLLFFVSLFLMTSSSSFIWSKVTILQNFQFPWRFLAVSVFIAAVIGGISIPFTIDLVSKQKMRIKNFAVLLFCILIIVSTWYMWIPKGYVTHDESFYTRVYPGTTDTGESSPIWSVRFMEHTPANPMEVAEGEAVIIKGERKTTIHEYKVIANTQTRLVENTLYFPGWKIYVDGYSAGVQFQDPKYRGLMTFWVDEGEHNVNVVFTDTKLRHLANMVSFISFGIVVVFVVGLFLWQTKK